MNRQSSLYTILVFSLNIEHNVKQGHSSYTLFLELL